MIRDKRRCEERRRHPVSTHDHHLTSRIRYGHETSMAGLRATIPTT